MIVHSHRRIIIQEKLDPPSFATDVNVATNIMNGRGRFKNKPQTKKMQTPPEVIKPTSGSDENSEEKPLIYARTANYDTDLKMEMTSDIKVFI